MTRLLTETDARENWPRKEKRILGTSWKKEATAGVGIIDMRKDLSWCQLVWKWKWKWTWMVDVDPRCQCHSHGGTDQAPRTYPVHKPESSAAEWLLLLPLG